MTGIDVQVSGLDGDAVAIGRPALDDFAAGFSGSLLQSRDEGFASAVLIWNAMAAKTPALVAQPATAGDAAAAVSFARDHQILLSVKGGGHNIAGTALADGGLTLDMSRMNHVEVDPDRRLARVGPGCLLQDVDRATQQHGLATVLGFVSETGVAGLTLGGGFGYLTRRFGWTVDNLEEVELVTADGTLRRASRTAHEDLFWALRGGGGNYGVATEFVFRLHQVGPRITGGMIAWSADRADEVLTVFRDLTQTAPRELTLACTMRFAPPAPFIPAEWHGKPIIGVIACHTGDPVSAARDLAPLRDLGQPIADMIVEKDYAEQQSLLDATQPKGLHYYWRSEFLPGLSDGLLADFSRQAAAITSPISQMILFHLAGALSERTEDDGAVGNRDAGFMAAAVGAWPADDRNSEAHLEWARTAGGALRAHSTGGNYVNFQTADDGDARTREAYRSNFERLAAVKAIYDPGNLFRVNRNVSPAAPPAGADAMA
ncbi:MAG TPA: FAD-binding oxidoreductase [Egibacteraceae bacterium]|nr:FAD-binding oxidoreductase [Egibacteraceae bacterium]